MPHIAGRIDELRRSTFSTCEGDDAPWSSRFSPGTADFDDIASGRDTSFWVKSVPLLPWVPFFAPALPRERPSSVLFLEFGQSSRRGYFARVPCYGATPSY